MPHTDKIDPTKRAYFQRRLSLLEVERSSFISHYKDLSEVITPRKGRFFTSDRNKGNIRHQSIINSKGTQAVRTATAGMVAGSMSPSRPWFRLATQDPELMEFQPNKIWLEQQERLLRAIFNSSNLYNMAPTMFAELLTFGTGCMTHVDDFEDVARFFTHTVGSYFISQNDKYVIDTVVREFEMTVYQLVKKFGLENVSRSVRTLYDRGSYDIWVGVVQFIEPNPMRDPNKLDSKFKPFRSVHYETGVGGTEGNSEPASVGAVSGKDFLSEKGFDEFPAYCPRWDVTGEDIYGTSCPGMIALGDIKSLQVEERRKAQAIDRIVNPPLQGPAHVRNAPVSTLPGGLTSECGASNKEGLDQINKV